MALHQLRSGEITADHVIVCIGTSGEQGAGNTRYPQSGNFTILLLGWASCNSAMHLLDARQLGVEGFVGPHERQHNLVGRRRGQPPRVEVVAVSRADAQVRLCSGSGRA